MKDDRVYLQHIRDALDDIARYCDCDRSTFDADRMRQDATLRKLEVIGQAVKNLSFPTKDLQPEVPWKQIAGMRDKVIHAYFGVNLERMGGRSAGPASVASGDHRAPSRPFSSLATR